jgi:hypothetical protein
MKKFQSLDVGALVLWRAFGLTKISQTCCYKNWQFLMNESVFHFCGRWILTTIFFTSQSLHPRLVFLTFSVCVEAVPFGIPWHIFCFFKRLVCHTNSLNFFFMRETSPGNRNQHLWGKRFRFLLPNKEFFSVETWVLLVDNCILPVVKVCAFILRPEKTLSERNSRVITLVVTKIDSIEESLPSVWQKFVESTRSNFSIKNQIYSKTSPFSFFIICAGFWFSNNVSNRFTKFKPTPISDPKNDLEYLLFLAYICLKCLVPF